MEIYAPGPGRLGAGLSRCALRVNLRYRPSEALLTLRGALLDANTQELRRLLKALAALPAAVRVRTDEIADVDASSVALLTAERDRRVREHAPPMFVADDLLPTDRGYATTVTSTSPCETTGQPGMPAV